jgi:DNA-binding transcriptional ArsR family regulator
MAEESFLLVSLDEEKSKKLAQVLSNDTSRKILDLLSRKDLLTETDISKELSLPLSTVHYNLSLLVGSALISDDNFNYSEKGKKVVHYTLSNKYVIIAPKNSSMLKERLRQFLPVVLITGLASYMIRQFLPTFESTFQSTGLTAESIRAADDSMMVKAVGYAPEAAPLASAQEFAIWFLAGSLFALLVYGLWTGLILKKR